MGPFKEMEHSNVFLKWLKDANAYISPKIAIKDYSGEGARLGVVALDDIKVYFNHFFENDLDLFFLSLSVLEG